MRKNKQNSHPCPQPWDDNSYHTGTARPPKRGNGLVVVLLIAVIFLGGMASAMGIINFRLISMMESRSDPVTPLSYAQPNATDPTAFLHNNEEPAPTAPEDPQVQLVFRDTFSAASQVDIFTQNQQSLVSVYCVTATNETLSGTGVVLSEDGFLLTNAHIVDAASRIFVYLPDGRLLRACAVGSDPLTDLAVLYVQAQDLIPAVFAGAASLQEDEAIYALIQQPDAQEHTIVSTEGLWIETLSVGTLQISALRSDLQGTSGPVFNSRGQIVAMQSGKISKYFAQSECGTAGIAIPSEDVSQVVDALISQGFVEGRPALGIQVQAISALYQHYWDLPGGLLVTVTSEHPCLQDGDILLTLDGETLQSRADLYAVLYQSNAGDELIAAVFRDGRTFTVTLTVEETA